ncbi:uncharacterized protein FTJAE_6195 [Fusarium tjaetaba]|uniref:Uncharacterized protein n=1 Tax=Fusarium tjaetaba TaxID=1567544 RepID=A0A8H5RPR3_9HYPO|nr:uncharacterized protein FTJAE_6195 [Fusarium tjaetaba]KAF5636247.1 hypothetical protein FTJAE_6195 [Fusarium tjaetaba]
MVQIALLCYSSSHFSLFLIFLTPQIPASGYGCNISSLLLTTRSLICTGGPPPYAPSNLSCIRRFQYYLCHSTYRQTFVGLLLPVFFGNMLIAIGERKYSPSIFWSSSSPTPILQFFVIMLLMAAAVLLAMAYGKRGDPKPEAAERIDLYLAAVPCYWY